MTRTRPTLRPVALALALVLPGMAAAQDATAPDATSETFRDWSVQCGQDTQERRVCEMVQRVGHEESGQNVLLFSIRLDAEGRPVGVLILPFGLRLSEGAEVRVGESAIGRYGFDTCLNTGCIVLAPFDEAGLAAMRGGSEGTVRALARNGDTFGIPISFWGFSAALDRLRALQRG